MKTFTKQQVENAIEFICDLKEKAIEEQDFEKAAKFRDVQMMLNEVKSTD